MRFTRLRLNGFKSFVDPTDLVIADGLTGVVGPNGCGKSNLLEALRWVMGENRPTAMRGGGMEDVIFAGASSRAARNFAEVSLVLDNSARTAPAAFNDADEIEVARRITREAGSAYRLNGREVRARDVSMLFADASTGAHSPALVRQGQISELISARPAQRRRILEEAAGISGLYQRRHEAELKLNATAQNLARLDDQVEQLAARLAQLSRQARQAARYREVAEELRAAEGLLLWRRWSEADAAASRAGVDLEERRAVVVAAEGQARKAEADRGAAEAAMPALREEASIAVAVLARAEAARDQLIARKGAADAAIRGLDRRLAQLDRDAEREEALDRDATDTIARLVAEEAALARAMQGQDEAAAAARADAADAAEVARAREADIAELTEEVAQLSARHLSANRLRDETRARLARLDAAVAQARAQVDAAHADQEDAEAARAAALTARDDARAGVEAAERILAEAEAAREAAQDREQAARLARAEAEGAAGPLAAEVTTLDGLLARDPSEGETVLDRTRAAPGYEAALGAVFGEELGAPLASEGDGWRVLPGGAGRVPEGAEPLAPHIDAPEALARALSVVGLVEADRGADAQAALAPGQVLVTRDGALFRWDGYAPGAAAAPSSAALRLRQVNRLEELRRDLAAARTRADAAAADHAESSAALEAARTEEGVAREARRRADNAQAEAAEALSRATGARDAAASRLETSEAALARNEGERVAARDAAAEAEAAAHDLPPVEASRAALDTLRQSVEAARMAMMARRAVAEEAEREARARVARVAAIDAELTSWRDRHGSAGERLADLRRRRAAIEADLSRARAAPAVLDAEAGRLDADLDRAGARRRRADSALTEGEEALRTAQDAAREAEREAGAAREARAAADARRAATQEARDGAEARILDALDCTPAELLSTLGVAPGTLPPAAEIEARVADLRRRRDALGAVNLRAEEDAREVGEEHDGLVSEKADLDAALAELRGGIAALNREGRQRLLEAFETVNRNFSTLFRHLFRGGEARLELIESDDPLEAGLEIMCQPPGKKLSTLSLLSGGEQTLTALALIFAVFLANPAPICVLDEVDAPLDDANVTRFCDMLDEMTRRTDTRFLIITHHAVTMARMDRLFGVTMVEQGVSQLVSVDLGRAEAMVA